MTPTRQPARRPRHLATHTVVLASVSLAAIAGCAKLGEDVFSHETAPFDEPIRAFVLAHQEAGLRQFFLMVTRAGAPSTIIPITAMLALWLRRTRGLPIASAIVLAPTTALATFVAVKHAYRRARPAGGKRLHERTYSFPSGHAAASAAICGTLAYVLWRERMLSGRAASALATVPTMLIGASRVYLDVHWSTDVLGGWSLGALVAGISAAFYEHVRTDTRKRGTPL